MTANKGLDEELEMEKLWSLDSFIHSISTDFQCGMLGKRCHWFHRHFRYWWHSLLYNVATGLRYFHYNRLPMTISFDIFFFKYIFTRNCRNWIMKFGFNSITRPMTNKSIDGKLSIDNHGVFQSQNVFFFKNVLNDWG